MERSARDHGRRRRLTRRALPALGSLAALVLIAVLLVASLGPSDDERAATAFGRVWERGDAAAMHRLLTPDAQRRHGRRELSRAYRRTAAIATQERLTVGDAEGSDGGVRLPVTIVTRAFGLVRGEVRLPITDGRVEWEPHMTFPGVRGGERLSRRTEAPPRAAILARDGRALVKGPAAARDIGLGEAGASVAGTLGPPPTREEADAAFAQGFPAGTAVGTAGLERILQDRVAGTPGGRLTAGERTLAGRPPRAAPAVRTTLDPEIQRAAASALGGRLGGITALDARTAEVRALAGVAFSAPQPPGSTFKIVTATAALEAKLVRPSTRFPVETKAVVDGVDLENANGERCGGTFAQSFARSCNSVFAPLGVKVGARRLLDTARRYGFDTRPKIRGALPSTLPRREELSSPLALGSTAIGQGRLLATPLLLASMAQAVANGGRRGEPSLLPVRAPRSVRVTSPETARTVARLMGDVVEYGTGTRASLAPVKVAGKTGTAELENTTDEEPPSEDAGSSGSDTDAWFTAFAPLSRPRTAVAVLFVRAGAGGDTAAPAAREVLAAALRKGGRR